MEGIGPGERLQREYYNYTHVAVGGKREPRWRGVRVVKFPGDLVLYSQVIEKRRPDWIVETGTAYGGSALFFRDMLHLFSGGGVITIDVKQRGVFTNGNKEHAGITQLIGSSTDPKIVDHVKKIVGNKKVMVVLDSDHSKEHVKKELEIYSSIVTRGQYLVVEDSWTKRAKPYLPWYAVKEFLEVRKDFKRYDLEKQVIFAVTRDGWLRKMS